MDHFYPQLRMKASRRVTRQEVEREGKEVRRREGGNLRVERLGLEEERDRRGLRVREEEEEVKRRVVSYFEPIQLVFQR